MITRRAIMGAAATSALLPLAPHSALAADPVVNWRMASSFNTNQLKEAKLIAAEVAKATSNKFTIDVFGGGSLVSDVEILAAVRTKVIPCGQLPLDINYSDNEALVFAAGAPFGLTANQHANWWKNGGGEKIINGVLAKMGVKAFPCGDYGRRSGGWYHEKVLSKADFKGLKIRAVDLGAAICERMGAKNIAVPDTQLYAALQSGVIEAADLSNLTLDRATKVNEVTRHVYRDNLWQSNRMVHLIVNLSEWNALPGSYRLALFKACAKARVQMVRRYAKSDKAARKYFVKNGIKVRKYPTRVVKAAKVASTVEMKKLANSNADFRKAWQSLKRYKKKIS